MPNGAVAFFPFFFILPFSETLHAATFSTLLLSPKRRRKRRRRRKCQFGFSGIFCLLQCGGACFPTSSSSLSLPHPPLSTLCRIPLFLLFFPSPSFCFDFDFVSVSSFPPPFPPSPPSSCFLPLSESLGSERCVGARLRRCFMFTREKLGIPI